MWRRITVFFLPENNYNIFSTSFEFHCHSFNALEVIRGCFPQSSLTLKDTSIARNQRDAGEKCPPLASFEIFALYLIEMLNHKS